MKKKKNIFIIIGIVVLLVLLFPFKCKTYEDGTEEYSGLMLKIINWTQPEDIGGNVVNTKTLRVYFFPKNLEDFETLRDEYYYEK